MTQQILNKIKEFAKHNFETCGATGDYNGVFGVYSEEHGVNCINPWIDSSARFELADDEAVKEWGLFLVTEFCSGATDIINRQETTGTQFSTMLDEYAITPTLKEDLQEFKSKDRRLIYPLWIGNDLVIIPHKRTKTAEINIIDSNGHIEDGYYTNCALNYETVAHTAEKMVDACYYRKEFIA